jgi:UDP-GlcNAc:undecaprenyl-phosphate GlcNAc-1-phosphate transferase
MTGAAGHLVVAFGLALGLASVLVVPMQWLARRTGLVAAPRPDRWNPVPVPLLGGPAMMVAVLGTFAALGTLPRMFWLLLLTGLAMGAVGLVDDIRALRPQTKFLAQLALASVLLGLGSQLRLTGLALVDILLTLLWVVGVTNAFNLLDNMDGLAAGVGLIAAAFRLLSTGCRSCPARSRICLTG